MNLIPFVYVKSNISVLFTSIKDFDLFYAVDKMAANDIMDVKFGCNWKDKYTLFKLVKVEGE